MPCGRSPGRTGCRLWVVGVTGPGKSLLRTSLFVKILRSTGDVAALPIALEMLSAVTALGVYVKTPINIDFISYQSLLDKRGKISYIEGGTYYAENPFLESDGETISSVEEIRNYSFRGVSISRLTGDVPEASVHFIECRFNENLKVDSIPANVLVKFSNCEFLGSAKFSGVGRLTLLSCIFHNSRVTIEDLDSKIECEIKPNTLIKKCNIKSTEITIEKEVRFRFLDNAIRDSSKITFNSCENLVYRNSTCDLSSRLRFSHCNMGGVFFLGLDISRAEFNNVKWAKLNGRLAVMDENFIYHTSGSKCYRFHTIEDIRSIYSQLVKIHEDSRNYDAAEDFYQGEMTAAARAYANSRSWVNPLRYLNGYTIYRASSKFGGSFERAAGVLLALLMAFTLLFAVVGLEKRNETGQVISEINYQLLPSTSQEFSIISSKDLLDAFSTTMAIVTLQKDRPLHPKGTLGSLMASCAILLIGAQAALLIFAIRRRFRRGSI